MLVNSGATITEEIYQEVQELSGHHVVFVYLYLNFLPSQSYRAFSFVPSWVVRVFSAKHCYCILCVGRITYTNVTGTIILSSSFFPTFSYLGIKRSFIFLFYFLIIILFLYLFYYLFMIIIILLLCVPFLVGRSELIANATIFDSCIVY